MRGETPDLVETPYLAESTPLADAALHKNDGWRRLPSRCRPVPRSIKENQCRRNSGPFQDATLENLIEAGPDPGNAGREDDPSAGRDRPRVIPRSHGRHAGLLAVKDPEGLASWQATYLQPNFDRAADTARQRYAVLMETREILADAVKQSTADATRQIQGNLDRLAEGAPEGFAPLFQAIRKGLGTHNAAFESFHQGGGPARRHRRSKSAGHQGSRGAGA